MQLADEDFEVHGRPAFVAGIHWGITVVAFLAAFGDVLSTR
ncbi:hypothetical protein [Glutamicibacter uratoxydans]